MIDECAYTNAGIRQSRVQAIYVDRANVRIVRDIVRREYGINSNSVQNWRRTKFGIIDYV